MDNEYGHGVAIKKVTNVFSKKILAKRALREIKLLRHFIGHDNVSSHTQCNPILAPCRADVRIFSYSPHLDHPPV